ncbi:MAG TPA: hypothetical protein VKA50_04090 [Gammaproteobacteria bacterium]|nr:hypothetical protein [Gammaproteobacteria bacterium]
MEDQNPAPANRSTFVTVVAWIFIAIAGFSTVMGILQNIMVNVMFSTDAFPLNAAGAEQHMPPVALFMFQNMRWLFLALLIASTVTLVAAIGMLLRKNWARRVIIAVLVLGIVWNLGGLVFQHVFISSMAPIPADMPPDFKTVFDVFRTVITVFSALIALVVSVLFGWIIKRLMSPIIRAEFS